MITEIDSRIDDIKRRIQALLDYNQELYRSKNDLAIANKRLYQDLLDMSSTSTQAPPLTSPSSFRPPARTEVTIPDSRGSDNGKFYYEKNINLVNHNFEQKNPTDPIFNEIQNTKFEELKIGTGKNRIKENTKSMGNFDPNRPETDMVNFAFNQAKLGKNVYMVVNGDPRYVGGFFSQGSNDTRGKFRVGNMPSTQEEQVFIRTTAFYLYFNELGKKINRTNYQSLQSFLQSYLKDSYPNIVVSSSTSQYIFNNDISKSLIDGNIYIIKNVRLIRDLKGNLLKPDEQNKYPPINLIYATAPIFSIYLDRANTTDPIIQQMISKYQSVINHIFNANIETSENNVLVFSGLGKGVFLQKPSDRSTTTGLSTNIEIYNPTNNQLIDWDNDYYFNNVLNKYIKLDINRRYNFDTQTKQYIRNENGQSYYHNQIRPGSLLPGSFNPGEGVTSNVDKIIPLKLVKTPNPLIQHIKDSYNQIVQTAINSNSTFNEVYLSGWDKIRI